MSVNIGYQNAKHDKYKIKLKLCSIYFYFNIQNLNVKFNLGF